MVALRRGIAAPPLSLESPRDWSHAWDQCEPPHRGEACYCIALVRISKRSKWRPRSVDAEVPMAWQLNTLVTTWSRSGRAIASDVRQFNQNQLDQLREPRGRIFLWAVPCWGICGFAETARPLKSGGKS